MGFGMQEEVMAEIRGLAADSPDPRGLLSSFERLGNALPAAPSKELLSLLARVFELSDFLPRMLSSRPALVRRLERVGAWKSEKPLEQYLRESALAMRGISGADDAAFYRLLSLFYDRKLARLSASDLVFAPVTVVQERVPNTNANTSDSHALGRVLTALVPR